MNATKRRRAKERRTLYALAYRSARKQERLLRAKAARAKQQRVL